MENRPHGLYTLHCVVLMLWRNGTPDSSRQPPHLFLLWMKCFFGFIGVQETRAVSLKAVSDEAVCAVIFLLSLLKMKKNILPAGQFGLFQNPQPISFRQSFFDGLPSHSRAIWLTEVSKAVASAGDRAAGRRMQVMRRKYGCLLNRSLKEAKKTKPNRTELATDFHLRRPNANLASEHKPIEVKDKHASQSKVRSSVVSADCSHLNEPLLDR